MYVLNRLSCILLLLKYLTAVYVEPPVADEVLLVEQRAIRTQEAVLGQALAVQVGAHVEGL